MTTKRPVLIAAVSALVAVGCQEPESPPKPAAAVAPAVPEDLYIEARSLGGRVSYELTLDASGTLSYRRHDRPPRSGQVSDAKVATAMEIVRDFQAIDTSAIPTQCSGRRVSDLSDVGLTVRMNGKTTHAFHDNLCPETPEVDTLLIAVSLLHGRLVPPEWHRVERPPPKPAETPRSTPVTDAEVDGVVRRYTGRFKTCASLHQEPPGEVRVEFSVKANGRTESVKLLTKGVASTKRGDCLEKVASAMTFPRTAEASGPFHRTLELP